MCGYPVFSTPLVEEAVFSPAYVFVTFVQNQIAAAAWVYFWVLYSVPLVYMSFSASITLFLLI
jgi:hypothetical protein